MKFNGRRFNFRLFRISVRKTFTSIFLSLRFHVGCLKTMADCTDSNISEMLFRGFAICFLFCKWKPKQKPRCAINNGSTSRAMRMEMIIRNRIKIVYNGLNTRLCDELDLINYPSRLRQRKGEREYVCFYIRNKVSR